MDMTVVLHLSITIDNSIVYDLSVLLMQQKGKYSCVSCKHSSSIPGVTFRAPIGGYQDPSCEPICPIKSTCLHSENCQNGRKSCQELLLQNLDGLRYEQDTGKKHKCNHSSRLFITFSNKGVRR